MAINVGEYLGQKYDILRQQATDEGQLKRAQASLVSSQAATNPAEAAAREAAGYGAAAQSQGAGAYSRALAAAEPGLASSEIGLRGAQTEEGQATAGLTRTQNQNIGSQVPQYLLDLFGKRSSGSGIDLPTLNNFSKGTDNVKGPAPKAGAKTTDTTPAMLTPGEAVLNKAATEHLGRDTIDVLNAIGNIKLGQTDVAQQPAGPPTHADIHGAGGIPGYAQGSSSTGQIDPIAGQGGTWGPSGDTPAPSGNTGLRSSLGLGVPRPAPAPKPIGYESGTSMVPGYSDGTSDVGDGSGGNQNYHNDTIMKARGQSSSPSMGDQNVREGDTTSSPKTQTGGATGYAKGTSKVPAKGGGKPAAKGGKGITPELIQAIMSLGKGGGGLIPPGQGAPMPMPMPQVAPGPQQ
jgi:hypothetical protein